MHEQEADTGDWIVLGRITRTQGHRGAVRLLPFFEPPERLEQLPTRRVRWQPAATSRAAGGPPQQPRMLTVESIRYHKQFVILTFDDIPDMTAAEALTGGEIAVTRDELWPVEEGQYFAFDLVGLEVVDSPAGTLVGVVESLVAGGAQDLLRVRKARDGTVFLIPFVRPIVSEVDLSAKRLTVCLPPGLDDI
ncbi:MAG: ribosome maturation factor RimM [Candidatus Sumerlaeaceae bacterium]|nr:ribosome maturation factor RimM [Candidatus Sumerlaeaceae bacterium]